MSSRTVRDLLDGRRDPGGAERELAALRPEARDEARRLLALTRAARRLPRAAPDERFVEAVMARVAVAPPPARPSPRGRLAQALLQLGVASAAAAFLAVAVARYPVAPREASAEAPRPAARARLVLAAPAAREVRVAGDFNAWRPEATPLTRNADGTWQVEVPVEPGHRYQYMFVVDGSWVPDPAAARLADDGFGGQNAVLET